MKTTISKIIIGLSASTLMFVTTYISNEPGEYLANRFAAPAAQRKCADRSWIWYSNSYTNPVAAEHRSQFCRNVGRISSPFFNPIPVKLR